MKKHLLILVALCLWQSSAWGQNKLSLLFEKQKGLILLYDEKLGETFTNDIERSKEVYPPCSTFKIPNSLIALDLKIIKNKQSHMRWDSKKHPKRKWWPSPWAKDQTLETAFRDSVLWFYQELAQKIGFENYQNYLEKFDYGNTALTGDVDEFWIRGSLRISAREQITFLQNFYHENFSLRKEAYETVKEIFVLEKNENWTLSGKTGTCSLNEKQQLGWLVGYFEKSGQVIYYVLQLDGKSYADMTKAKRIELVKKALMLKGYLNSFEDV